MSDTAAEKVARVEDLLGRLEALPDATARQTATEAMQALLDLYGEGLRQIVELVAEQDDGTLAESFASNELIAHLFLLHDLHPVAVEQRVQGALEEVLPYLESHGGSVQLLGVEDRIVRLRLQGSCSGCPSSAMTLKLAIEDAIFKAAPDVEEVIAEGATVPNASTPQLLQLEVIKPMVAAEECPATPARNGAAPDGSGAAFVGGQSGEQAEAGTRARTAGR